MRSRCLIGVCTLALLGAAPKDDAAPTELAPGIQGTWKCTAFEYQGRAMTPMNYTLIISSDVIRYYTGDSLYLEERYHLSSCANLNTIDFERVTNGQQTGYFLRGIYALEGDEIRLCWGDERPSQFTSVAGPGRVVCRLKRVSR